MNRRSGPGRRIASASCVATKPPAEISGANVSMTQPQTTAASLHTTVRGRPTTTSGTTSRGSRSAARSAACGVVRPVVRAALRCTGEASARLRPGTRPCHVGRITPVRTSVLERHAAAPIRDLDASTVTHSPDHGHAPRAAGRTSRRDSADIALAPLPVILPGIVTARACGVFAAPASRREDLPAGVAAVLTDHPIALWRVAAATRRTSPAAPPGSAP